MTVASLPVSGDCCSGSVPGGAMGAPHWSSGRLHSEAAASLFGVELGVVPSLLNVSGYVHSGKVKFVPYCYNKTVEYRERVRNELLGQVCGFRIGEKMKHEMDLLDCFTYGVALGLGNSEGF